MKIAYGSSAVGAGLPFFGGERLENVKQEPCGFVAVLLPVERFALEESFQQRHVLRRVGHPPDLALKFRDFHVTVIVKLQCQQLLVVLLAERIVWDVFRDILRDSLRCR